MLITSKTGKKSSVFRETGPHLISSPMEIPYAKGWEHLDMGLVLGAAEMETEELLSRKKQFHCGQGVVLALELGLLYFSPSPSGFASW